MNRKGIFLAAIFYAIILLIALAAVSYFIFDRKYFEFGIGKYNLNIGFNLTKNTNEEKEAEIEENILISNESAQEINETNITNISS